MTSLVLLGHLSEDEAEAPVLAGTLGVEQTAVEYWGGLFIEAGGKGDEILGGGPRLISKA